MPVEKSILNNSACFFMKKGSKLSQIDLSQLKSTPYVWIINRVIVHPKLRNQGVAARLIQEACTWADESNITLMLYINPYGDLNYAQLCKFYAKFGFADSRSMPGVLQRIPQKEGRQ